MMESARHDIGVEELLARGLDHYGRGEEEAAITCWREVLAIRPDEERAKDYLSTAGAELSGKPPGPVVDVASIDQQLTSKSYTTMPAVREAAGNDISGRVEPHRRQALEQLTSERKFEEALELAYTMRREAPADRSLSKAIQLLKARLLYDYTKQIGCLDDVPRIRAARMAQESLTSEARIVLRLADGIATYGDILESCRLGSFKVSQVLVQLLETGVIESQDAPDSSPVPCSRAHAALETPRPILDVTAGETDPSADAGSSETGSEAADTETGSGASPQSPDAEADPGAASREAEVEESAEDRQRRELREAAVEAYLTGDHGRAAEQFRALLALDPGDQLAIHSLARLEKLSKAQ